MENETFESGQDKSVPNENTETSSNLESNENPTLNSEAPESGIDQSLSDRAEDLGSFDGSSPFVKAAFDEDELNKRLDELTKSGSGEEEFAKSSPAPVDPDLAKEAMKSTKPSYGTRMVGGINNEDDFRVNTLKRIGAEFIDHLYALKEETLSLEKKSFFANSIVDIQSAVASATRGVNHKPKK